MKRHSARRNKPPTIGAAMASNQPERWLIVDEMPSLATLTGPSGAIVGTLDLSLAAQYLNQPGDVLNLSVRIEVG